MNERDSVGDPGEVFLAWRDALCSAHALLGQKLPLQPRHAFSFRDVIGNARSARGVDETSGCGSDKPERTARSCDLENTAPGWRRRICGHDNLLFLVQGAAGEVSGSRRRYVFPIYASRWLC